MLESWDEVIVQRYVDGREVNVGLIGDTVLPIAEIDFKGMPEGAWKIVTYQSKWITGSEEDLGAVPVCPARLPKKVAQETRDVALAAWKLVGGTGYGRVDMRIDADGRPWILEVNANPDIAPDAGLARMAGVAGMPYSSLIREICQLAFTRPRDVVANDSEWALAQRLSGVALDDEKYPVGLFAQGGQ
jgi:D-alanine-D-alanine ligase